jgi:hypothetical protein
MNERAILASLILLITSCAIARGDGLFPDTFRGHEAFVSDSVLASPAFEGRLSGSTGGTAAENWIASRFSAAGLLPGMRDGSWYQPFPVVGYQPKSALLEILNGPFGRIHLVYGDDFSLMLDPAAGKVTAEAVIVGYGIDASKKGRNDYAGCDVTGKIAVVLRGRPEDGQNWDREFMRTHTFAAARAHGAVAVLFYQGRDAVNGAALAPEVYDAHTPSGYVSERVVRLLLRETGYTLEDVQEKLKAGPFPFDTGKRVRFEVAVRGSATSTGRDVVGVLPGSDPVLKDEVVVIGAHHDHLGLDADGRRFPGASDNASGASAVIEMARAAQEAGWRPKRTVLFMTFGGEEMGLLGSRAIVAHLPVDSSRVVAMINLDMVGLGDGGYGTAGAAALGAVYFRWRGGLDSTQASLVEEGQASGEHSDYAPFMEHGIPVVSVWSRGQHGRYHDLEDLPRYIQPEVLESVGRGIGSLLAAVADAPERLRDGYGRERILRSNVLQVTFDPITATQVPEDRMRLSGANRIAGRLVGIDPGQDASGQDANEPLQKLGALIALAAKYPWARLAVSFRDIADANGEMRTALFPVMRISSLDRLGDLAARSLCAAGLAGALWSPGDETPPRAICGVLAKEKRVIIGSTDLPWRNLMAREPDLRLVLRWDSMRTDIPAPPDSAARARVLLVAPLRPSEDWSVLRKAIETWGATHVHLDVTDLVEDGAPDSTSLRVIRRLIDSAWPDIDMEAVLGGNLGGF